MGQHLPDYQLTDAWVDLASLTGYTSMQNADVIIQAKYVGEVYVFIGGSSAPTGKQGTILKSTDSFFNNAVHWWVRGTPGHLSVLIV